MSCKKGLLMVVSGFSGAGKGSIVRKYIEENKDIKLSISATTRERRTGEIEGVHYYYISKDEFEGLIDNGEMLEYTTYVGNYYGTPKTFVDKQLQKGNDVILEIEMEGAFNVKKKFEDPILIFIAPPKASDLKERLIKRGTEDMETINNRIKRSNQEVELIDDYDYVIINENLDKAVQTLDYIRFHEKNKVNNFKDLQDKLSVEFKELID